MEPAVSVPIAAMQSPAATAAAEPDEDPPVMRSKSQGFFAGPKALTMPLTPNANSCRFSLPTITAPACFNWRTSSASSAGTRSRNWLLAAVVRTPAVSRRSFSPIGMPCRGPRQRPAMTSASACRACSSADSAVTVIKAFRAGFSRSMRERHASRELQRRKFACANLFSGFGEGEHGIQEF